MPTFSILLIVILAVVAENNYRLTHETVEHKINREVKKFLSDIKYASLYDLYAMSVNMHNILDKAKKSVDNYGEIETKLICAYNQRKYQLTSRVAVA